MNQEHQTLGPNEESVVRMMIHAAPIEGIATDLGVPVSQAQRLADGALDKLSTYQTHSGELGGEADEEIERLDELHQRVLALVAKGFTNAEIGLTLKHKPGYIKVLVEEVLQTMHVSNRVKAAVRYATWRGRHGRGAR